MGRKELEKKIAEYYEKWSTNGLNQYEKIALKKLEYAYKKAKNAFT